MLRKKAFYIFILLTFFIIASHNVSALDVSAKSAVVINAQTNEIVFEKNCNQKLSMASTTKIMTSLLACTSGRMNDIVTVVPDMLYGVEGTAIGLKPGYKMSLRNLVYGMLLESGNDAAQTTAFYLGGSVSSFALKMNGLAKQVGMKNTNFVTPSGLDSEEHYTTAYDMALLGAYAVKNPEFRSICSTKSITVDFVEPQLRMTFSNHNRLLRSFDGAFGIKTGFTKKSGRCLVSAAERNGVCFVAVTLNAPNDWNDHKRMLEYAFENVSEESVDIGLSDRICIEGAKEKFVSIRASENPVRISYNGSKGDFSCKLFLPAFIYAPVSESEIIGYAEIYKDDELIKRVDIVSTQKIECIEETYVPKKSILQRIKDKIRDLFDRQDN